MAGCKHCQCSKTAAPRPGWIFGEIETASGRVPVVRTRWTRADILGSWKVRWGLGRMDYKVDPGLYAVGAAPGPADPVLATANYKLSFDHLRGALAGRNAWILVLDTRGVNVWCAAGKGTFGTAELVARIRATGLETVISRRTVVVPQLGAPGVAAHAVLRETGFRVVYGPVAARDVGAFLDAGMTASPAMRVKRFPFGERLALVPLELVPALKFFFVFAGAAAVANAVRSGADFFGPTLRASGLLLGAILAGAAGVPALLPWLPFRALALKGWFLGLVFAGAVCAFRGSGIAETAAMLLALPPVSAFLALNFTGATTYTSQNGVNREIRLFVRPMAASAVLGAGLLAVRFAGIF